MIGEHLVLENVNIFWYKVTIKTREYTKALTECDSNNGGNGPRSG